MNTKTNNKDAVVDYCVNAITDICKNIGPREPGSKEELAAFEYFAKDIKENKWADSVTLEEFSVAPKAFMSFSKIIPILILAGIILYLLHPVFLTIFAVSALVIVFFEFLLYKPFLDPLFKKATSHNLIAIKRAKGEIKKRIIFSGHVDCAYEWTVFRKFGPIVNVLGIAISAVGAIVSLIISIITLINKPDSVLVPFLIMLIFIPGYVSLFFFSNYKRIVPGANDNLTGSAGSVALLKYLKDEGIEYENTEVQAVLMGSEEAGLRGAKAWAKKYAAEYNDPQVETVFIGLETFRDIEHLYNYVKDLTGTVKHHPKAIALIDKVANKLYGKPFKHASVYVGASDSAAVTQGGICAGAIAAMDPAPARYYHTREDNEDNLSPECISKCMDVVIELVETFNKDGLDS